MVRQAHHERGLLFAIEKTVLLWQYDSGKAGQSHHQPVIPAHKTVVPAKAGIQEIPPEKTVPATDSSGFRLSPERRLRGCNDWLE